MKLDELEKMAQQTAAYGVHPSGEYIYSFYTEQLQAFAALVASAEREACHALRQTLPNPHEHCQVSAHAYDMAIAAYGSAIRARGQA